KVTEAQMATAQSIMFNRVNSAGFTEAQVVPQGTSIMTVSVPGRNSSGVVKLVIQTAELLFRQVLLIAPNQSSAATPTPSPTPSGTASAEPSGSASPQPSSSATTKAKVQGRGGNQTAVLAHSAGRLGAVTAAHAKASPTPTPPPSAAGPPPPTPPPPPPLPPPDATSPRRHAL